VATRRVQKGKGLIPNSCCLEALQALSRAVLCQAKGKHPAAGGLNSNQIYCLHFILIRHNFGGMSCITLMN